MRSPGRTLTVSTVASAGQTRWASRRMASSSVTRAWDWARLPLPLVMSCWRVAGVGELVAGEGLFVAVAGGLDVFDAGAGLEDGEMLAGGLG